MRFTLTMHAVIHSVTQSPGISATELIESTGTTFHELRRLVDLGILRAPYLDSFETRPAGGRNATYQLGQLEPYYARYPDRRPQSPSHSVTGLPNPIQRRN